MGRTMTLTESQWDELDRVRMGTASADIFRNCTIILMSAVGRSKASISKDLGCCTDTVVRVRRLYRQGGVTATRWDSCLIMTTFTKRLHDS